jgi:ankyrin repeat protein
MNVDVVLDCDGISDEDMEHYPLHVAALRGNLDDFKIFIDHEYSTSFMKMVYRGFYYNKYFFDLREDSIKLLRGTPLHTALRREDGNADIVHSICRNYPNCANLPDSEGLLPIHYAAYRHPMSVFMGVLDASPEAALMSTRYNENVAHFVARGLQIDLQVIDFVVTNYAFLSMANKDGELPLHLCAQYGSLDVFMLILEADEDDVTFRISAAGTSAHHAILRKDGNGDILKYICQNQPDVLAIPNCYGQYPLHFLLNPDIPTSALLSGIDILDSVYSAYPSAIIMPDIRGQLPLHYLNHRDDWDILLFLLGRYPDVIDFSLFPAWPDHVKRNILKFRPGLNMAEYHRLNWQNRRFAMCVAVGLISDTKRNEDTKLFNMNFLCLRNLGQNGQIDMLREVISFL